MNAPRDLTDHARALYQQACEQVDLGTRHRLRAMRARALAGGIARRAPYRHAPRWAMAAGVLLLVLAWPRSTPPDIELPSAALSLEAPLLDEDPAIFDWLATAPVATSEPGPEVN